MMKENKKVDVDLVARKKIIRLIDDRNICNYLY